MRKNICSLIAIILSLVFLVAGCKTQDTPSTGNHPSENVNAEIELFTGKCEQETTSDNNANTIKHAKLCDALSFSGSPYVAVNDNIPLFSQEDYTTVSFEHYSELDSLGRCGVAYACIGRDIMPTEDRGEIGQVKPSGWQTVKYDVVNGKYLYNRCHLIGFQLAGENTNVRNLITGTRYLNIEGMLPFENMVADYVKETGNHVLYRVTPIFKGNNLLADGVQMEAISVEDSGKGICFNVFCYNVQPQIQIDYSTGKSQLIGADSTSESFADTAKTEQYILNENSKKFHRITCSSAKKISVKNAKKYIGTRAELIAEGYSPCGLCEP